MNIMSRAERIAIQVSGAMLDAQLHVNKEAQNKDVGLLLCHPYPLLGGSMHDPVVAELYRCATASGAFCCVLRYNQRGVGRSSGSRSLRGAADLQDVEALCSFLMEQQLAGPNKRVFVVGYSWGACLASRALSCPGVGAYVGVSFPLGGLALLLAPRRHFEAVCAATTIPRLLVLGAEDQYAKATAMQRLVLQQPGGATYDSWAVQQAQQEPQQAQQAQQLHAGEASVSTGSNETLPNAAATAAAARRGELTNGGGDSGGGSPPQNELGGGIEARSKEGESQSQGQQQHDPLPPQQHSRAPAPLLLWCCQGADHFWMEGGAASMAKRVVGWLEWVAAHAVEAS